MEMSQQQGLFQIKPYRYLVTAQLVSSLGDWLDYLALLTLVGLRWHAAPLQLALAIFAFAAPSVLFGALAGVIADRFERKTLMIVSDLFRCGLVLGLTFAHAMWQVYLILVLKGTFEALFTPAKSGKLREIVLDVQIEKATSVSTMIDQTAKIIGPVLSGILVAAFTINTAFYIDALSFIVSAALLTQVPRRAVLTSNKSDAEPFIQQLKEGLRFMKRMPVLLFGTITLGTMLLVLTVADSQIIALLRMIPHITPALVATVMASSGIGMFIGAAVLSKKSPKSVLFALAAGSVGIGMAFGCAGLLTHLPVSLAWVCFPGLFLFGGAAAALVFIPFQAMVQKRTPVELSGRVNGTLSSVMMFATVVGPIVGGVLATLLGIVAAFVLCGAALLLLGCVIVSIKNVMEQRDASVTEGLGTAQGTASA